MEKMPFLEFCVFFKDTEGGQMSIKTVLNQCKQLNS